ncbi:peptidase inhibitor family I36 protein [Chengkuizengella sp. SCS-71B]|uniref:peptidase inhibitor family I36 protein n=1 Tax=Chengkuizengella sp. SCS-71B TaxID=3115290 RepID=UPI0032C235EB
MIESKRITLFSFIICLLFIILISMSVFSTTEVSAQEREGYKMIDRGTYKVYVPKETVDTQSSLEPSNLKSFNLSNNVESGTSTVTNSESEVGYLEPELNIPALGDRDPVPKTTYDNRTSFRDIEPERYIPVNLNINSKYYKNDLLLSELNAALDDKDPFVDTFLGIYNPDTGEVSNYFPIKPTSNKLTLLLNKHSYFAENLTLDVEEWWEVDPKYANSGYSRTGETHIKGIKRDVGVTQSMETSVAMTHGTGVDLSFSEGGKLGTPIGEMNWEVGVTFNYNFAHTSSRAFSRTMYSSYHDEFTVDFGGLYPKSSYKWAVYDLMTRTKINYSSGDHFDELDDTLKNDIDNLGLTLDMSSYMVTIRNLHYATMAVPIYEQDSAIQEPTDLTATQDFQNITITLNWDAVPADKIDTSETVQNDDTVAGYYIYKNGNLAATIHNPSRTSWVDQNVEVGLTNTYYLKSFSNYKENTHLYYYKKISLPSNVVTEKVELNAAQFKNMVIGCSIPFTLTDNQISAGERTYYILYIGNPAVGGIEVGKFEGKENGVNITPELYDLLKENTNKEFYIVKEVLYNGETIRSSPVKMPGKYFTVTETAFLFSKAGFNGDCVTVGKTVRGEATNLNSSSYNFDNKLSSMLVQGNLVVHLNDDLKLNGFSQSFFTDEDGFAYVRDFKDKIIGANTVSSLIIRDKVDAVYFFSGPDFTGTMKYGRNNTEWWAHQASTGIFKDNDISSVKVVGPYAVVLFDNNNYSGGNFLIKEDYGDPNLASMDNRTSSYIVYHGEGVWLFDYQTYRGNYKRFLPVDANTPYNCRHSSNECGFPGDTLSSVLVIGDYGVTLYEHPDYRGRVQAVKTFDQYSGSTGDVGDNLMSSFRVFPKGVYLGQDFNFKPGPSVLVKDPGNYSFVEKIGLQDNSLSSIFIVGDYKVTLYADPVFKGNSLEMYGWLGDFRSHPIGNDTVSSLKIEEY